MCAIRSQPMEVPSMSQTTANRPLPRIPPEEAFWQRYSPHHELPLSTISSFALHLLLIGLAALLAWAVVKFGLMEDTRPFPAEVGFLDDRGGGPAGNGPGPGIDPGGNKVPEAPPSDVDRRPDPAVPRPPLVDPGKAPRDVPEFNDPGLGDLLIESSGNIEKIRKLPPSTRKKLLDNLAPGNAGGHPGGDPSGAGPGNGGEGGPGTGALERKRRVLRWTLIFNTQDGHDYARQLHALGAVLAIPDPKNRGQYLVIQDLAARPVRPQPVDLAEIQRIYWIDDKPDSVRSLARALGFDPVPEHVVAFFPLKLEQQLLDLELNYRKKKEHEIKETRFEVRRKDGTYVPVVVSQR
jgi:hypothetical protein